MASKKFIRHPSDKNPLEPDRVYVLTEDVVNPKPDRRQKYDWRAFETIPKGTRFVTKQHALGLSEPEDPRSGDADGFYIVELYTDRWSHHAVTMRGSFSELFAALVPHLEEVEPTLKEQLKLRDVSAEGLLYHMVDKGFVSPKLIDLAITDMRAQEVDDG